MSPEDKLMKAFCSCLLLLLGTAALRAQDEPQHSPFGCSNHAVQLDIERKPALKFTPLRGIPQEAISSSPQHSFRFSYAGPFTFVTVQLAATIGEQLAGRGLPAKLGVYVETKQDNIPRSSGQFWQLVSTATQTSYPQRTSERLAFDSNRVAQCLKSEDAQCRVRGDHSPSDCLRTGELRWVGAGFQSAIDKAQCKQTEKPGHVQVDNAGKVKLSFQSEP